VCATQPGVPWLRYAWSFLEVTAGEQDAGGDQSGDRPGNKDQQGPPWGEEACLGVPGHDLIGGERQRYADGTSAKSS